MAIARMIVRTGLLTVALMSAVATAKAICNVTRLPSRSDDKPPRRSALQPLQQQSEKLGFVAEMSCSGARILEIRRSRKCENL